MRPRIGDRNRIITNKVALDAQVICVPGHFFDVNPGKRRLGRPSRFRSHVRFSFGPPGTVLKEALTRLKALIDAS